jgi:hypothetical protein
MWEVYTAEYWRMHTVITTIPSHQRHRIDRSEIDRFGKILGYKKRHVKWHMEMARAAYDRDNESTEPSIAWIDFTPEALRARYE